MTTFVPTTLLLGKKLLEVNGSFSGMTLHQFLNETGNSHLFIKKDGMVATHGHMCKAVCQKKFSDGN